MNQPTRAPERGAAQPVAAQVLHARGERQGRRLDRRRRRVPPPPPAPRRPVRRLPGRQPRHRLPHPHPAGPLTHRPEPQLHAGGSGRRGSHRAGG